MKFSRSILSVCLFLFPLVSVLFAQNERPPNVIVILADDLGCGDMSLYDGWIQTPHIDKMASEGVKFTDFHSNSSVCSPTRVAFMTGRYQQRLGVVDVIVGSNEPDQGILPSVPTIPRIFKDHGYATAIYGKWHCGYPDKYNPIHHGFDEFVGFLNGGSDYYKHGAWKDGLERKNVSGYTTHILTEKAVDFIKRNKEKPFFLYIPHAAVHNPYHTPADTPESRDPNWKENRCDDINRPRYKVILDELDKSVGTVLDTLKSEGLAENTIVIFWSDNGAVPMNPNERPFRGGKFSQYEGGHRVPAVAWWPGHIKSGWVSNQLVVGFDWFPTLVDIAGFSDALPKNLDGKSIKSHLLEQKDLPARDIFFGYEPKLGTAMRRGDWKMIVKETDVQLYDLKSDIKETTNLAEKKPEIRDEMLKAIEHFKETVTKGS